MTDTYLGVTDLESHTDPLKPFYLVFAAAHADGTLVVENECAVPHATEQAAIDAAVKAAKEYGGEHLVYLARVVVTTRVERILSRDQAVDRSGPDGSAR